MKKLINTLLFITIAIILVLTVTYPSVRTFNTKYIGDGYDNYQYAGFQNLAWQNIRELKHPFSSTQLFRYPVGIEFSKSFDGAFGVLLGAVLLPFFGSVLSYNVSVWITLLLNLLFSFMLFRYVTKSWMVGFLGAVMYGLSPYALARGASHLNLALIAGFPYLAFAFVSIFKNPEKTRNYAHFYASILIVSMGSLQYSMIAFVTLLILFLYTVLFNKKYLLTMVQGIKKNTISIVFFTMLTAFALGFLFFGHITSLVTGTIEWADRATAFQNTKPSFMDFVLPNAYNRPILDFGLARTPASIEKVLHFGFIEIVAGVACAIYFFKIKKVQRLLLLFSAFFVLTLGIGYSILINFFPFSGIAENGRFYVFSYLLFSMLIVMGISFIKQKNIKLALSLLVILFLIGERTSLKYPTSPALNDEYTKSVSQQFGTAVLDIPISPYYPKYDVLPIWYNKPIVNGYIHWTGDDAYAKSFISDSLLQRFWCYPDQMDVSDSNITIYPETEMKKNQQLLEVLKTYDIRTLVIHKDDKYFHPICKDVRRHLSLLFPENHVLLPDNSDAVRTFAVETPAAEFINYSFHFSQKGQFTLYGFLVNPSVEIDVKSSVFEGQKLDINTLEYESHEEGGTINVLPPLVQEVDQATRLDVTTKVPVGETFYMTMWYSYKTDQPEFYKLPITPTFTKFFESTTESVYQITDY